MQRRHRSLALMSAVGLLSLLLWPLNVNAEPGDPIRAARDGLQGLPWYDDQADQLKRPEMAETRPVTRRAGHRGRDWNRDWNRATRGISFGGFGRLMEVVVWALLFIIIGLLVYALVRTYLNADALRPDEQRPQQSGHQSITDQQRIENLPIDLRSPQGDLLSLAHRNYTSGDFSEAIIYLFSHRLMQLDKAGMLRLAKGKTNRQYLHEVQASKDLQQILGQTIVAFERVFFGHHTLTQHQFEECWQRNESFQALTNGSSQ